MCPKAKPSTSSGHVVTVEVTDTRALLLVMLVNWLPTACHTQPAKPSLGVEFLQKPFRLPLLQETPQVSPQVTAKGLAAGREASPVKRGERPPRGATAAGLAECDGQAFGHHTRRLFAAHKRQTGVHIGVSVWSQSVRTGNGTPAPSHTSATAGTWRPRDLTKASVGKYNSLRKENPATCGRLQGSATVQRPTQHTSQPVRCRRSRRCWAGRSVGLSVRRGCKSVDGRLDCLIAPN